MISAARLHQIEAKQQRGEQLTAGERLELIQTCIDVDTHLGRVPGWTPAEVAEAEARYFAECIESRAVSEWDPILGQWITRAQRGRQTESPTSMRPSHYRPQKVSFTVNGQWVDKFYSSDSDLARLRRDYKGAPVKTYPYLAEGYAEVRNAA